MPKADDTVTIDGSSYRWRTVSCAPGYVVDLTGYAAKLNLPVVNVIFWGIAYITAPEEMVDARLAIGSDDSSIWWVNGKEVIGAYGVRQTATDDNVSRRLTLNRGVNIVRFYDARQRPITNLIISLVPPTSNEQQTTPGQHGTRGQRGTRGLRG
ncbi:MAG: hypothetical protein P8016_12005, partial [Sedimentisphaerales bacterium]